jgi:large subunit ribosomal protein L35
VPRKARTGKFKLKTHKSTSKRFRVTGTGLVIRTKGGKSHFRRRRAKRNKALLPEMLVVTHKADAKRIKRRIKRLAPYLSRFRSNPTA